MREKDKEEKNSSHEIQEYVKDKDAEDYGDRQRELLKWRLQNQQQSQ